ncbi:MAG: adenosylcobinamide-GDP ribazoletransferase, partial [Ruminococcus sp.]|nr:adenosylcobinamide-GDP ribazoletransferase [Ruminococcus sp.]
SDRLIPAIVRRHRQCSIRHRKEKNRRYSLCFFPLVGAVIGGLFLLWNIVSLRLKIGKFLYSAVSVTIPIIVTGGIHIDGFCDVNDAKSAYGDKEKRFSIMKDSHIGTFAVLYLCVYLIFQTALFSQMKTFSAAEITAVGYVLSRSLSAFSALTFRSANPDGSLQNFVRPAHKKITMFAVISWIIACTTAMVYIDFITGTVSFLTAIAVFFYYKKFAYKTFGGTTGDLCGWFLQVCEISILTMAVFAEILGEYIK